VKTGVMVCSLLEEGRTLEADELKQRLEQLQRDRLRQFTDAKALYSPRWFMSVSSLSQHSLLQCF